MVLILFIILVVLILSAAYASFVSHNVFKRIFWGGMSICLIILAIVLIQPGTKAYIEMPGGFVLKVETSSDLAKAVTGHSRSTFSLVNKSNEPKEGRFILTSPSPLESFSINEFANQSNLVVKRVDGGENYSYIVLTGNLAPNQIVSGSTVTADTVMFSYGEGNYGEGPYGGIWVEEQDTSIVDTEPIWAGGPSIIRKLEPKQSEKK